MNIKGLLVDLDGTLYVGDELVEGAIEAVSRPRDAGLAVRYVTNTTRVPRREVVARMRGMGFEVDESTCSPQRWRRQSNCGAAGSTPSLRRRYSKTWKAWR